MFLSSLCPSSSRAALYADISAMQYTVIPLGHPSKFEKQSRVRPVRNESVLSEATHHMRLCRVAGGVGVCWDVYVVDRSKNTMQTHVDPQPDRHRCLYNISLSPLSPVNVPA